MIKVPFNNTVKVLAVSDLHGAIADVPRSSYDIFINAGDVFSHVNRVFMSHDRKSVNDYIDFHNSISAEYKVIVAGNHDFEFEVDDQSVSELESRMSLNGKTIIVNRDQYLGLDIRGKTFRMFCSPMIKGIAGRWAFEISQRNLDSYEEFLKETFTSPVHMMVTHSPKKGVLDGNYGGDYTGIEWPYEQLKPNVHIHGHIHEAHGSEKVMLDNGHAVQVFNIAYPYTKVAHEFEVEFL